MDRRQFLMTGAAALSVPALSAGPAQALAFQATPGSGDAALNAVFERIFQEQVRDLADLCDLPWPRQRRARPAAIEARHAAGRLARREETVRTDKFIGWLEAVPEAGPVGRGQAQSRSGAVGSEDQQCRARSASIFPTRKAPM